MYQTQFDLTDKDLSCSEKMGRACLLGPVSGCVNTPKVSCVILSPRCRIAVDVVEKNISASEFTKMDESNSSS